ncbi:Ref family recombination enhancement nuclease [Pusillimonas sp. T7-7]|uniref:Ref family recombination enhancement nuclease n=1 Tax=Pusillimonas sp. (strain T7-7) TaxID=1007105 RepID=UPI0011D29BAC|nr:Ref family recombination enhancement nuclease [Pusillimonas sp. T7-7]
MTRRSSRKTATKQERNYMSAQADAGCILCRFLGLGDTPAEIHHLRDGVGSGQRNSNLLTIPLCPEHHRGNTGFHGMGRRAFEREYGVTEMDLWAMAQKQNPATLAGVPGLQSHLE